MNTYYSILDFTKQKFAAIIEKWGMTVESPLLEEVVLKNAHCRIQLLTGEGGYIRFWFSKADGSDGEEYSLSNFLDTMEDGAAKRFVPSPDYNLSDEQQIDHYMECYEQVLLHHFDRPLSGDFGWKEAHDALVKENKEFDSILMKYSRKNDPRARVISKMQFDGDPRWKEEVRKLAAS